MWHGDPTWNKTGLCLQRLRISQEPAMLQPQCKTMWNVVLPALKSFNPLGGRECWRPCLWDFAKGLANELSGCSSHPSNSDGIHELTCLRCLRRSLRPLRHDVYVVHILPCKVSQGAADVRDQMVSTWDATTKESSAGGVSSHQVPNSGGPAQPDMPFGTGWASCPSCRYDIGISNTPTLTFEWLVFDIPSDVSGTDSYGDATGGHDCGLQLQEG